MTERPHSCPICSRGTLADITYDEARTPEEHLQQQPGSRQVDVYTCGHEVPGTRLEAADDRLDVERRNSRETAEPLPQPEDEG
jgi:hypothetical protein